MHLGNVVLPYVFGVQMSVKMKKKKVYWQKSIYLHIFRVPLARLQKGGRERDAAWSVVVGTANWQRKVKVRNRTSVDL